MTDTPAPQVLPEDLHQKSAEVACHHACQMIRDLIATGAEPNGVLAGMCRALVWGAVQHLTTPGGRPTVRGVNQTLFPAINQAAEEMCPPSGRGKAGMN